MICVFHFSGVVVFVDVRTKSDNRSQAVAAQLQLLGASVANKFDKDVTHVVFKDGAKSTHNKAVKMGISMVTVLWVESCKEQGRRVDEKEFIVSLSEEYTTPNIVSRFRKYKSMQPRSFEEDLAASVERVKRRNKRINSPKVLGGYVGSPVILAPESSPRPPMRRESFASPQNLTIPDTPTSMMKHMERLQIGKGLDSSADLSISSPLVKNPAQPLERRLDVFDFNDDEGSPAPVAQKSKSSNNEHKKTVVPKKRLLSTRENILDMSPAPKLNTTRMITEDSLLSKPSEPAEDGKSSAPHGKKRGRKSSGANKENVNLNDKENNKDEVSALNTTRINKRRKTCDTSMLASYSEHIVVPKVAESKENDATKTRRRSVVKPTLETVVEKISKSLHEMENIASKPVLKESSSKLNQTALDNMRSKSHKVLQDSDKLNKTAPVDDASKKSRFKSRPSIYEFKTVKSKLNASSIDVAIKDFETPTIGKHDMSESFGNISRKVQVVKPLVQMATKKQSIVMTSLHTEEQEVVIAAVKSLGGFIITESVNEATTHIVCGEKRRTINLLAGIARGCWVVSKEWVLKSIEERRWLDEAEYEMADIFPTVKTSRLKCHGKGGGIFSDLGLVHVNRECKPPKAQLESLLAWSGAEVTSCLRKAQVNIAANASSCHPDVLNVTPAWVLDCIMSQQQIAMDTYSLYRLKREGSPEY